MTIEFHCPHCDKLLKTPDDKAGVRANCPGCGETVTVPDPALEAAHADASLADVHGEAPPFPTTDDHGSAGEPASTEDTKTCPMCGASVKKAATRCRFCGEEFVHEAKHVPTRIDIGDVISRSWNIFQRELGLLLGAWVIQVAIGFAVGLGLYFVLAVAVFGMLGQGGGPPNPAKMGLIINVVSLVMTPLIVAFNAFFDAGMHVILLKVARGQPAEIGDLFTSGRFYWRVFLVNLIVTIPGMLGNLLQPWLEAGGSFIGVAGQFLLLLFIWPSTYLIVDRDVGVMESFRLSRPLTALNYGPTILIGIIFVVLGVLGILACCVGWIFTIPLAMLMFGVAYCAMSGQAMAGSPGP